MKAAVFSGIDKIYIAKTNGQEEGISSGIIIQNKTNHAPRMNYQTFLI